MLDVCATRSISPCVADLVIIHGFGALKNVTCNCIEAVNTCHTR